MAIELKDLLGKNRMLHSAPAESGAESLLKRIENGDFGMEVLPNTYAQFTGDLEELDYVSYCRFLNSSNGEKVLHMLEEEDERKSIEL